MSYTLQDIKEHIINTWDPIDFIEWFDITTRDLVELFEDYLIDDYDALAEEFETESKIFNGSEES